MAATVGAPALRAVFGGARVLVTGGGGFIARHLTSQLLAMGAEVVLVGSHSPLPSTAARGDWPPLHQLSVGDEAFGRFLERAGPFDYIFHLAARTHATGSVSEPFHDFTANLVASMHLLEQLRQLRQRPRLVLASSAAVYGSARMLPIEETDQTVPLSPYGVSKLAMERYAAVYARLYGLSAASLRPFSVYGPFQRKQVVYALLEQLRTSPHELVLLGDGTQVRDLVYVADVARAFLVVAARGRADGFAYNAATGVSTSLGALARQILEIQGADARISFSGVNRPGDQDRLVGSNAALAALGWAPAYSVPEGLRETAAWFNDVEGWGDRAAAVGVRPETGLLEVARR